MNDLILRELMDEFPVTYSGQVELLDEHNQPHQFHILEAYNTDILVGQQGSFWMSESEIGLALGISKTAINNAISRFMNSKKGQLLARTCYLRKKDRIQCNLPESRASQK